MQAKTLIARERGGIRRGLARPRHGVPAPHAASGGLGRRLRVRRRIRNGRATTRWLPRTTAPPPTRAGRAGKFGSALSFNGTSSWVTVPDSSVARPDEGLHAGGVGQARGRHGHQLGRRSSSRSRLLALVYAPATRTRRSGRPARRSSTAAQPTSVQPAPRTAVNVWTHVATTWDGPDRASLRQRHAGRDARPWAARIVCLHRGADVGGNSLAGEFFKGRSTRSESTTGLGAEPHHRRHDDLDKPSAPPADATPPRRPTRPWRQRMSPRPPSPSTGPRRPTTWASRATTSPATASAGPGTATAPVTTPGTFPAARVTRSASRRSTPPGTSLRARRSRSPRCHCPDTAAPSAPAAFAAGATTTSSIVTVVGGIHDNVGVAGYTLYKDGSRPARQPGRRSRSPGFSAARPTPSASRRSMRPATSPPARRSSRARRPVRTSPRRARRPRSCRARPARPRSRPRGSRRPTTSASPATRCIETASAPATATSPLFTFAGLTCGTSYTLGVEASTRRATSRRAPRSPRRPRLPRRHTAVRAVRAGDGQRDATSSSSRGRRSTDNVGVAGYGSSVTA